MTLEEFIERLQRYAPLYARVEIVTETETLGIVDIDYAEGHVSIHVAEPSEN